MIDESFDSGFVQSCLHGVQNITGFEKVELKDLLPGRVTLEFDTVYGMANRCGTVHGGFFMAVADIAACLAATTGGRKPVTLQCDFNFVRAAELNGQHFRVDAQVVHNGRTTQVVEVKITGEDSRIFVTSTFTTFSVGEFTPESCYLSDEESRALVRKQFDAAGRSGIPIE